MLAFGLAVILLTTYCISVDADPNRRQLDIPAMRSYFDKFFPYKGRENTIKPAQQNKDNTIIDLTTPLVSIQNTTTDSAENKALVPSSSKLIGKTGQLTGASNPLPPSGLRYLGQVEQSRGLAQSKGELGNPLVKNNAFSLTSAVGSPAPSVASSIPFWSPIGTTNSASSAQGRDSFGSLAAPKSQFGSPVSGLSKSYGVPKATYGPPKVSYGPPKAAIKPSKGYGVPPRPSYGPPNTGLGFGKPTFGNPLATPQLPGSGLFEPLGPNVPIGPSEPTFGDPGLVGGILNSPPPFVPPAHGNKNTAVFGSGIGGPRPVPLQKPPLKESGFVLSLLDLPLDIQTGIGDGGPAISTGSELYPPLGNNNPLASPIEGPALHLLNGPVNFPLAGGNGYEDGLSDDVGHVSSFSYFRSPEFAKDLDYRFLAANKIIAEQFHLYMTDRTGFPGNVRFRELEEETAKKLRNKELPEGKGSGTDTKTRPKVTTASKKLKESTQDGLWSVHSRRPSQNEKNVFLSQVS